MLLTDAQVLTLCEKPRHRTDVLAGQTEERRHRLHVDGPADLLTQFVNDNRLADLTSDTVHQTVQKLQKAATKPIYGSIGNILSKIFTAGGSTYYYEFSQPELAEDFEAYLSDESRTGTDFYSDLHRKWFKAAQTEFQGYFLVDLPADATVDATGRPAPFHTFVPSKAVWDVELTGDRVEYLIAWQVNEDGTEDFWAWDDQQCHRVRQEKGKYTYLPQLLTTHALGFVPAVPPTRLKPDPTRPVRRTSILAESLEIADVYLRDFNGHELTKARHVFPRPWSYGVPCDHETPSGCDEPPLRCSTGWMYRPDGTKLKCPRCNGEGRYIPLGADRGYIVQAPTSNEDPDLRNPAGYITPDIQSVEYIGQELAKNEAKIEKAVLGKEGILTQQTKVETAAGKDMDLGPVYDRLSAFSADAEFVTRFVTRTKALLRYGPAFRKQAVNLGRRYQVKSVAQIEAQFKEGKLAGLDDAVLYSYLEDLIYTKYQGDPMELQRNLLKLELTPFPTQTVKEAKDNGVATAQDLLLKQYLNDFVARFERENGSILDFGSALPHATKIERIQEQFTQYLTEKTNGTGQQPPAAADPASGSGSAV